MSENQNNTGENETVVVDEVESESTTSVENGEEITRVFTDRVEIIRRTENGTVVEVRPTEG